MDSALLRGLWLIQCLLVDSLMHSKALWIIGPWSKTPSKLSDSRERRPQVRNPTSGGSGWEGFAGPHARGRRVNLLSWPPPYLVKILLSYPPFIRVYCYVFYLCRPASSSSVLQWQYAFVSYCRIYCCRCSCVAFFAGFLVLVRFASQASSAFSSSTFLQDRMLILFARDTRRLKPACSS